MTAPPLALDAIKGRAEAASDGPWVAVKLDRESDWRDIQTLDGESVAAGGALSEDDGGGYGCACPPADAEFIAHAREDVPALVAEVERLRAEASDLRALLGAQSDIVSDLRWALWLDGSEDAETIQARLHRARRLIA